MKITKFNNICGNIYKIYEGKKKPNEYGWDGVYYVPNDVGFNRLLAQLKTANPTTTLFENVNECVQYQNYVSPKNVGLAFGLFSREKWVDLVLENDRCITAYYDGNVEVHND